MDDIIILGSGLAGLSCAYHLKDSYQIFEKNKDVGGLTRSVKKKGFIFDFDGHLLHFKNRYTQSLISNLLETKLLEHKRDAYVYFRSKYLEYPFQARINNLPDRISKRCIQELIKARENCCEKRKNNFYDWIINRFGKGMAKYFFIPYNSKFWTVPLKYLTAEWVDDYIPVPTIEEILKGYKDYGYNVHFWYPENGGIETLTKSFKDRIKPVNVLKEAKSIDLKNKTIQFTDNSTVKYKSLVSSIPLPEMSKILTPLPKSIRDSFKKLKYNSIYVLNIGLKKNINSNIHWVYFPEEKFPFYRIGFYSNFSDNMAPDDCSSVYVEIAYSDNKPIDKAKVEQDVIRKLQELKLIDSSKEIELIYPVDIKYGYVIYDFDYRVSTNLILNFLKANEIYSIGRYGAWEYKSMEDVILEGKNTAGILDTGSVCGKSTKNEDICSYSNL